MRKLWSWSDAGEALGLDQSNCVHGPDLFGISIDSRTLEPGDLFIALKGDPGERFNTSHESTLDGHDYIQQAFERGAAGVLAHLPPKAEYASRTLLVEDTLDGLWNLARAARARLHCPVFAITGSSGKTTLRNFLGACLEIDVSPGSLNNFWGLPLSMARTHRDVRAAIFELGTNSPGEIAPLANLARPDIAVVLNVYSAHIANFANLDAIREEKLSIVSGLGSTGVLVLPQTMTHAARLAITRLHGETSEIKIISFGEESDADIYLKNLDVSNNSAVLAVDGQKFSAKVPGGGAHRAQTVAATLACLCACNENPNNLGRLSELQPPQGRGNHMNIAGITLIDDSYNANPGSMEAALRTLKQRSNGACYAILGDMLELGEDAQKYHTALLDACEDLAGVYCVGQYMAALYELLPMAQRWGQSKDEAAIDLQSIVGELSSGDTVLIKGSNRTFWTNNFVAKLEKALE